MKESIYTIPISEAFEENDGCAFCKIHERLETRWIEYITGPAMMEPDVRLMTNKLGFCRRHYDEMLLQRNRLSVALILQTHLGEIIGKLDSSNFDRISEEISGSCFVCDKVEAEFDRILENVAVVWAREDDFKKMYIQQKYVCFKHASKMLKIAKKKMNGKNFKVFNSDTKQLVRSHAVSLKADIDAFCNMFDYRNAGAGIPSEDVKTAIERAISFLDS